MTFIKTAIWLAVTTITWIAVPTLAATDKSCLTGNDPAVRSDAAQLAALEVIVDEVCPCGNYDGSTDKTHRDYLRCAKSAIKIAVRAGQLRTKCKARVTKAFQRSTCGFAAEIDAVPCLDRTARGKLTCIVIAAADCQDRPHVTRTQCPEDPLRTNRPPPDQPEVFGNS